MGIYHEKGNLLEQTDCLIRVRAVDCNKHESDDESRKYPDVQKQAEQLCCALGPHVMGEVQFVPCDDGGVIANVFVMKDGQLDIPCMEECIDKLALFSAKANCRIGFPMYAGAGQPGEEWDKIHSIIQYYFGTPVSNCVLWEKGEQSKPAADNQKGSVKEPEENSKAEVEKKKRAGKKKLEVTIYADGSCIGAPGPGGWGAILTAPKVDRKEISGAEKSTTAQHMELLAAVSALKTLRIPCNVTMKTGSSYLVNSVNKKWMEGWKADNWTHKGCAENADLWKELDTLMQTHTVSFVLSKGNVENGRCLELSKLAIDKATQA